MRVTKILMIIVVNMVSAFSGLAYADDWVPPADGFELPVQGCFHATQGWHIEPTRDFRWVDDQYVQKKYHLGEDWNYAYGSADLNKPVYAVANGKVTYAAAPNDAWKGIVIIEHYVPGSEERFTTTYAHVDEFKITDWVKAGDWDMAVYRMEKRKI